MARQQQFEHQQALQNAMSLFWRQGYTATSLQQLLDAMGLSRSSLYASFGDKKALFIQVAALSDKQKIEQLAHGLESLYQVPTATPNDGNVFRLRLGPLESEHSAQALLQELHQNGYENAYKLYDMP